MRTSLFPTPPLSRLRLSVVMAVYNEAETVATAIERVLTVEIEDVEIELVVVESNSTDGTRDVVSRYATDPRVRVVLQDAPRGKGAAVREGFEHVTGGIVLIQDADLEYSVDGLPEVDRADHARGRRLHARVPPRPWSAGARDGGDAQASPGS